ncbi:MAG: hypothetical protein HY854_11250 [Burkholderiales bacterium]|nr:hypothetical protein [Burkholderiales bacterium]
MTALPRGVVLLAVFAIAPGLLAAGGDNFDFMPRGGRAILVDLAGGSDAQLRALTAQQRSEDAWRALAAERKPALADREQATFAAYMAVHMPLAPGQGAAGLPRDGRDTAWEHCQSCHSLFSSFLTQGGSAVRWRNMFLAPFHRNIRMTPKEREDFARYGEINMPMRVEDIPPELRF